ncbi:hypothetical protein CPB84DRAFT_1778679 [Gymnopilus junonius]|uniref:Uncharacterized protein n=1 Tax=Gymnopilus junonius TaxID=109634 RepID=A0A9P5TNC6_GYMJU|nr:hypothetical protein CPB84DRAFT_1778679 [Gymnopilus junonius]
MTKTYISRSYREVSVNFQPFLLFRRNQKTRKYTRTLISNCCVNNNKLREAVVRTTK